MFSTTSNSSIGRTLELGSEGQEFESLNGNCFYFSLLTNALRNKIVNIGESSKLSLSSNVGGLLQVMPNANGRTNTLAARGLVMRVNVVSW